ncbi:YcbK family protein [Mycoplana ramosa]|uniref:YcbK family protein n=1 Tax=Mycoplana ramosa TaxID=40837 RepID=A0ABW3Z150_MYCRA
MRNACSILLAGLFTLSSLVMDEARAGDPMKVPLRTPKARVTLAYATQTPRVRHSCFPGKLHAVLAHIAAQTGRRPLVTSGHRSGGRRGSYHRKCMAADIRIPGVAVNKIIAAARSAPGIGGIGTYCNGIVHVDVGPSRRWNYCGRGLARLKKQKTQETTTVAMR